MTSSVTIERPAALQLDERDVTLQDILVRVRKQWPEASDDEIYFSAQVGGGIFQIEIRYNDFPPPETRSPYKEVCIYKRITFAQILRRASHYFPGQQLSELRICRTIGGHAIRILAMPPR